MTRRLAVLATATALLTGAAVSVPHAALAYPTVMCEDNGFPREIGVSDSARIVFVGVEQTTPLVGPAVGARLCFEVNFPNGGGNVVGYDLGVGLFYDVTNGLRVELAACGHPTETSCSSVGATGVTIAPGDLPAPGIATGCIATVASFCVFSPSVTYGGDTGNPTLVIHVAGIAVPVDVSRNCVSIPPTTC